MKKYAQNKSDDIKNKTSDQKNERHKNKNSFQMLKCLLIASLIIFGFGQSFSQQTISGAVIDKNSGEALTGVSITDLSNQNTTLSKINGQFSLAGVNKGDTLLFAYLGYNSQKKAPHRNDITIKLTPSSTSLNTVVVSANRGDEAREDVPSAISTISAKMLKQTKATELYQVLNKVSGVYMVDLGNEQHMMAIRQPITTKADYLYLEDGIPIRIPGDFNHNALLGINQAAVKRVEVIKGPSSAIYGGGGVGGTINFITKSPALYPDANVEIEGNNFAYHRINLTASNTFNKTGVLVSGYYAQQPKGYDDEGRSDFNKEILTARVDQSLSDHSKLTAIITGLNYNSAMKGSLDSSLFYEQNYNSFYTFNNRKVQAVRTHVSWQHFANENAQTTVKLYYVYNTVEQNPSYRVKNDKNNPLKANGQINNNHFQSFGLIAQHKQTFKFWNTQALVGINPSVSPAGYIANYINIDRNVAGYYTDFQETDSLLTHYDVGINNLGTYAQIQTAPLKNLRFTLGVRYDYIYYNFNNFLPPSAYTGAPDSKNIFQQVTPKFGLTYNFSKNRGLYANYSIGFAPPDVSDFYGGVKVPHIKPTNFRNYEIGGWIDFSHHKGYATVSIYDMQGVNEVLNVRLSDGTEVEENAGRTAHYGIEYTVKYKPVSQLFIKLSGTNARHLFVTYNELGNDYGGNEMSLAPHWIMNGQITYAPTFLNDFNISFEWQHIGHYFMDDANTMLYPGYNIFNVRINKKWKNGLYAWVQVINLANTLFATLAEKTAYNVSYDAGTLRTFNIGIGYHFQGHQRIKNVQ